MIDLLFKGGEGKLNQNGKETFTTENSQEDSWNYFAINPHTDQNIARDIAES